MARPFAAYRALLAVPGGTAQAIFGMLGRAPMSMLSVAFVASASLAGGDAGYALGGLAAGAWALAGAVGGPVLGRLADHHGQGRVAMPFALLGTTLLLLTVASLLTLGATWLLVPAAAFAGLTVPSAGSFARARWSAILHDPAEVTSAQALESILDEVTFLVGPAMVAVIAGVGFAGMPIAMAAVLLLVGMAGMTSRLGLPAPQPHPSSSGSILHRPEFPAGAGILVASLVMGVALGSVQVLQLAYTRIVASGEAAALVFFVNSLASLLGAIWVGSRAWKAPVRRRFTIALVVYGVALLPSALVGGYVPFVIASILAGMGIAPTFIQVNALIAEETPARSRTTAFAIAGSATVFGIALGAAVSGWITSLVGGDTARLTLVPLAVLTVIAGVVVDMHHARAGAGTEGSGAADDVAPGADAA